MFIQCMVFMNSSQVLFLSLLDSTMDLAFTMMGLNWKPVRQKSVSAVSRSNTHAYLLRRDPPAPYE